MKKVIISTMFAFVLMSGVASAQTTQDQYRTTILNLIKLLMQQVELLQKQLAAQSSMQPLNIPASYEAVDFDVYRNNPNAYLGKKVSIIGMRNDFLPRGGSGGDTNYIEVVNPIDPNKQKIEMKVTKDADYTAAVSGLQSSYDSSLSAFAMGRFYGVGVSGESFTNGYGTKMILPVLLVQQIDRCKEGELLSCSRWEKIMPQSSIVSQLVPPPTNPSNALTFQTPLTGYLGIRTEVEKNIFLFITRPKDYISGNQFIQPGSGKKFVNIYVQVDSESSGSITYNPLDFSLQDKSGNIYRSSSMAGQDPRLPSGTLNPSSLVAGNIGFEVPSTTPLSDFGVHYEIDYKTAVDFR